ncbi:hypothetical protein OAQ99_00020 [Candidatus Kapabacteria bacterium]|nr:hypothetical protein [Candidatus Kapabacteria bacterium]
MQKFNTNNDNRVLKRTLEKNRNVLLNLVDSWNFFKNEKYNKITFEYEQIFGDLEFELSKKNSELESLQSKINELINHKVNHTNFSSLINKSFISEHQSKATSALYRKIVKLLHPDVCEDQNLNQKYWDKVQNAYKSKNKRHLEIIFDTITKDYSSLERDQIRLEINKLERYISQEKINLETLKKQEPFIYENKLSDSFWVKNRKSTLESKLSQAEKRLELKKRIYNNIRQREKNSELVN